MGYSTTAQKLQGDPGLFGSLGKLLSGASKILPGPAGIITGFIGGKLGGGGAAPVSTPPFTMPGGGASGGNFGRGIQQQVPTPGIIPAFQRAIPGGQTGMTNIGRKKRRRMDPLNVKALRRSTRRLAAFQREAKKVEKELRKLAPPARRRSASHHHHPKA